jgi:hypothetical protein
MNLARDLVNWNTFDGAEALRLVAMAAQSTGAASDVADILEEADQAARRVEFPPWRADMCGRIAASFASIGLLERALSDHVTPPLSDWERQAIRLAVANQLAADGKAIEALKLLPGSDTSLGSERLQVIKALMDAGEKERAIDLARNVHADMYRSLALATVAARARPPENQQLAREALELLATADDTAGRYDAEQAVAHALMASGQEKLLLDHLRGEWSRDDSHFVLTRQFDSVEALVAEHPGLAQSLLDAEHTVDIVLTSQ